MTIVELCDAKQKLGMTWAQLAKETGYSERHLYNCFAGKRKITKRLQIVLELFEERMENRKK